MSSPYYQLLVIICIMMIGWKITTANNTNNNEQENEIIFPFPSPHIPPNFMKFIPNEYHYTQQPFLPYKNINDASKQLHEAFLKVKSQHDSPSNAKRRELRRQQYVVANANYQQQPPHRNLLTTSSPTFKPTRKPTTKTPTSKPTPPTQSPTHQPTTEFQCTGDLNDFEMLRSPSCCSNNNTSMYNFGDSFATDFSFSHDGSVLCVGSRSDTLVGDVNNPSGVAFIYRREPNTGHYMLEATPYPNDMNILTPIDYGTSCRISDDGTAFAVSANFYGDSYQGRVWVFRYNGTNWTQDGQGIFPNDVTPQYQTWLRFGSYVRVNADASVIAVFGIYNSSDGAVWTFHRSIDPNTHQTLWIQDGSMLSAKTLNRAFGGWFFGSSFALDRTGSILAISYGSYLEILVLEKSEITGNWFIVGEPLAPPTGKYLNFEITMTLDGLNIFATSWGGNEVYWYTRTGPHRSFSKSPIVFTPSSSDLNANDVVYFGYEGLAVSGNREDGMRLAVGAFAMGETNLYVPGYPNSGALFLFEFEPSTMSTFVQNGSPFARSATIYFGSSVNMPSDFKVKLLGIASRFFDTLGYAGALWMYGCD
jgi:hypothetical protein